jgi:hypothetical protein
MRIEDVSMQNIKTAYYLGHISYDDALARMAYLNSDKTEPYKSKDVIEIEIKDVDASLVDLFRTDLFFQAMLIVALFTIVLFSSACAPKGSDASTIAIPDALVPETPVERTPITDTDGNKKVPETIAPIVMPSTGTPIQVMYYSKTILRNLSIDGYAFSQTAVTGSCATVQAKTYCWDDGLKGFVNATNPNTGVSYGQKYFTYWGIHKNNSNQFSNCSATCLNDVFALPLNMVSPLSSGWTTQGAINTIMQTGVLHTEDCLENSGKVTCPSVEITLAL